MVDTTQATMRHTIGHAVLLENHYHSATIIMEDTVVIEYLVLVFDIVIGAALEQ